MADFIVLLDSNMSDGYVDFKYGLNIFPEYPDSEIDAFHITKSGEIFRFCLYAPRVFVGKVSIPENTSFIMVSKSIKTHSLILQKPLVSFNDYALSVIKDNKNIDVISPFTLACELGDFDAVKMLWEYGSMTENWQEKVNKSLCLKKAFVKAQNEIVEFLLLKLNVDLSVIDDSEYYEFV